MKLLIAILVVYVIGCVSAFVKFWKDLDGRSGYEQNVNELYAFQKSLCDGCYDDEFLLKDSRKATKKYIFTYCILWPIYIIAYLLCYLDNFHIRKGL